MTLTMPDSPGATRATIGVRASGVECRRRAAKHIAPGQDPKLLPLPIGYEVAGVITALGPGTRLASGGGSVGDEVVASPVTGGYTTAITVPASSVFAKPATLSFAEAASLLNVRDDSGGHAARLRRAGKRRPSWLHGAAGAVGVMVLQRGPRLLGAAG